MANAETDFLILGAGVTGLSAAVELGESAIVVEKENRPGGLVKTHCFNDGYWFDHVLHLLRFKDAETQSRIECLMGDNLQPCPPTAWINCAEGTVLYPFQLNLGALNKKARNECISDYAKMHFTTIKKKKRVNYHEYLTYTFGDAMCDLFYFPYNEKLYKYPLDKIITTSLTWNLHRPSFEEILDGCFNANQLKETYNTNAFYPCPPEDASQRGMEVLVQSLASQVNDLRVNAEVIQIETKERIAHLLHNGVREKICYDSGCLSTLPLPKLMHLCSDVPKSLLRRVDKLTYTKVYSVAISVKGKRPENTGHWRYYTNPAIPFTRLIFMTEFDTFSAPQDGWGLLAEITCAGKENLNKATLIQQTIDAVKNLGYLNTEQQVIDVHVWPVEFAYVVFTPETRSIVTDCFKFLDQHSISTAGRYGNWQYSSIYQNIKEGFTWANKVNKNVLV